jgi:hypothetical protein
MGMLIELKIGVVSEWERGTEVKIYQEAMNERLAEDKWKRREASVMSGGRASRRPAEKAPSFPLGQPRGLSPGGPVAGAKPGAQLETSKGRGMPGSAADEEIKNRCDLQAGFERRMAQKKQIVVSKREVWQKTRNWLRGSLGGAGIC